MKISLNTSLDTIFHQKFNLAPGSLFCSAKIAKIFLVHSGAFQVLFKATPLQKIAMMKGNKDDGKQNKTGNEMRLIIKSALQNRKIVVH